MPDPNRDRRKVQAHQAFTAHAHELRKLDLGGRFTRIYETNLWGSEASRSGSGSADDQTAHIREQLPGLLKEINAASLLDIPCGDFAWMRYVDLDGIHYIGGDIVPGLIERNQTQFGGAHREFRHLDLTADLLPRADMVLCRDCLVHLSSSHIWKAVANLKRSGCTWLLTTTFPDHDTHEEIEDGDWRLLNLELPPFGFPPPVSLLNEGCTEGGGYYPDKSLGLWRIADLPESPSA